MFDEPRGYPHEMDASSPLSLTDPPYAWLSQKTISPTSDILSPPREHPATHQSVAWKPHALGFNCDNHVIYLNQNAYLVGGSNPLKNISQVGLLFPIYGTMKHGSNHKQLQ